MFVETGEPLHPVGLAALSGEAVAAWATTVHRRLHGIEIEQPVGRASVDDAADGGSVALAEVGEAVDMAECVHFSMVKSVGVACVKSTRARGAMATCSPRCPAETNISSSSRQSRWMKVGSLVFIPTGEQPPRI